MTETLAETHPDWKTPVLCTWCGGELAHADVYVSEYGNWTGICPDDGVVYVTTDPAEVTGA